MTRTALEKLNEKQLTFCKRLSTLIDGVRNSNDEYDKEVLDYRKGNLKGYLSCLEDMGVITQSNARVLYTYFATIDRK